MNEIKINYVIATYAGIKCVTNRENFVNFDVHPRDYLKFHLEQLLLVPHNLTQVTIMKANTTATEQSWESYYEIDDIINKLSKLVTIKIHNVENHGVSYGQFIKSYNLCKNDNSFDYYIFTEDDYIPSSANFDFKLINEYKQFGSGLMCAWASKAAVKIMHAAHSLCIVNTSTLQSVFSAEELQLQKFNGKKPWECQIIFSQMFSDLNYPLFDYSKCYYTTYWTGRSCVDCCNVIPINSYPLFVPLQMFRSNSTGITPEQINEIVNNTVYSNIPKQYTLLKLTKQHYNRNRNRNRNR